MAVTTSSEEGVTFRSLFDVITFKDTAATLTAVAGAETEVAITVPGAALGDIVVVSVNADTAGASLTADVTAANTVTVTLANATGSTVTIASGTVRGVILKPGRLFDRL